MPVLNKDRVASSMALMVFAHSSLPHKDGEYISIPFTIVLGQYSLRGGM
jgi:hypothetical protein